MILVFNIIRINLKRNLQPERLLNHTCIMLNGLTKDSSADCFQVRSVSQERFIKRLGNISEIMMNEIQIGLSKVLSIDNE